MKSFRHENLDKYDIRAQLNVDSAFTLTLTPRARTTLSKLTAHRYGVLYFQAYNRGSKERRISEISKSHKPSQLRIFSSLVIKARCAPLTDPQFLPSIHSCRRVSSAVSGSSGNFVLSARYTQLNLLGLDMQLLSMFSVCVLGTVLGAPVDRTPAYEFNSFVVSEPA